MSLYSLRDRQKDHLHETLQVTLRRNGIEIASLKKEANGSYTLQVKGHDSPLIEYTNLSQKQVEALTDGGTISSNKKAYNTFASIVAADFDIPKNYTLAQNARSRVNMGQYGHGGYSGLGLASFWMPLVGHPLFRSPRDNHHLGVEKPGPQRHYFGHGRFIPPLHLYEDYRLGDEKLKPGELFRNSSGFYYKANAVTQPAINQQEALTALENLTLQKEAKIYQGDPIAYKDAISSDVYFSAEKFNEVLASHGINIDAEENTMIVHAKNASTDFKYYLNDEELAIINNPSLKEYPIEDRLEVINNIISEDYLGKVSIDTLNSKTLVDLSIRPEILQRLKEDAAHTEQYGIDPSLFQGQSRGAVGPQLSQGSVLINGNDLKNLDNDKGWYREGKHGREVEVGDILVEKIVTPPIATKEEAKEFQSKVEDLTPGVEKILITDPENLTEVEVAFKNRTISLETTSGNIDFHIAEVEKNPREDGYTLTDENGNKINVPQNNILPLSIGKYARIEVMDEDGLFDHYAQALIKPAPTVAVSKDNSQLKGLDPNLQYNGDVKYKMSAVIDGKVVSHEITQKQYDKFMALDDMHRMKMFSQIFGEVDMKSNTKLGEKIGAAFLATAAFLASPTLYAEAHFRGPAKPPIQEMAAHNFEEMMMPEAPSMHRGI